MTLTKAIIAAAISKKTAYTQRQSLEMAEIIFSAQPLFVRLSPSAFPAACRKAHDLIDWLNNNSI